MSPKQKTATPGEQRLSRRERQILDALYQLGEAPAEEVRVRLPDPPSYSAVRAMLAKLEGKGQVRHREEGLRYLWAPTVPRGVARRSASRRLVEVFFGGSTSQAVTALLDDAERLSPEELAALAALIAEAREKGGER